MSSTFAQTVSVSSLADELLRLVRRGFAAPLLMDLEEFPALRQLTGTQQMTPAERALNLHDLLKRAISQLPEPSRAAMRAVGEMEESTAGRSLGYRRQVAAKALGIAATTFRTHKEPRLIKELAQTLVIELSGLRKEPRETSKAASNRVLVIHAHDASRHPLFELLRSWGLQPQSQWAEVATTASASPLDLLQAASQVAAIIVLLTPARSLGIDEEERDESRRSRDNLMLELGLALGMAPERTVIVSHGEMPLPSDILGRPVLRLDNRPTSRNALRSRLQTLGCEMEDSLVWLDPARGGDFGTPRLVESPHSEELIAELKEKGYELEASIGEGPYGATWLAKNRQTEARAVIRAFSPLRSAARKRQLEAFDAASSVTSKSLPTVAEVVEGKDGVAIVLDAVDGVPLGAIGNVTAEESVRIASEILEALFELHAKGVVHRDLSPANIMLVEGGRPVLADFGMCRILSDAASDSEQRNIQEAPGKQQDNHSVGLLLLSLLKKSRSVQGTEQEIETLDVSDELKHVLRRLIEPREDRPEPQDDVLKKLRAAPEAAGLSTNARQPS